MTETHAYLPAKAVFNGCLDSLKDIDRAREQIADTIRSARRKWWHRLIRVRIELTEDEQDIVRIHRAGEEDRIRALGDLSYAAFQDDESFRVYISVEDFRLIKEHYEIR